MHLLHSIPLLHLLSFSIAFLIGFVLLTEAAPHTTGVPIYVMLPLDLIDPQTRQLNNPQQLQAQLSTLKQQANIDGVLCDMWWGIVEQTAPHNYYWQPYQTLINTILRPLKLKLLPIMSFHSCGGNVGDECNIPLPPWVTAVGKSVFYTDREGRVDYEYLSAAVDNITLFQGRTPLNMYSDYMINFRDNILFNNSDIISQVEISLGPAGELRFPAYPTGTYPGVGEFQCYDPYMLQQLKQAAIDAGQPEWGNGGPGM